MQLDYYNFLRLEVLQATKLYDFNYYVKVEGSMSDCAPLPPPFKKKIAS